tara:strand:+ start:255 stop:479 length:225 start_codon:yes stop_codon:yes gene_type:complete
MKPLLRNIKGRRSKEEGADKFSEFSKEEELAIKETERVKLLVAKSKDIGKLKIESQFPHGKHLAKSASLVCRST